MPVINGSLSDILLNKYANDVFTNDVLSQITRQNLIPVNIDHENKTVTYRVQDEYDLAETLKQCVQTTDELLAEDV